MATSADDTLHTSLAGLDRRVTTLWVDGHAKDLPALAEFGALETLSIYRLPKRHLPLVPKLALPRLTGLAVRHLDAPDLRFAAAFPTLETLTVWQSKKVAALDGIEDLRRLNTLALMDLGPIGSLAPLARLPGLRHLELRGGVWSKQGLPGLAPLAALRNLEVLDLGGAKVRDSDLRPIAELGKLRELGLSARNFPPEAITVVAAAHGFWLERLLDLQDFDTWAGAPGCAACGARRKVMFLRRHKLLWCPRCEAQALKKQLDGFRELVAQKRAEL